MPLLQIQTNTKIDGIESVAQAASKMAADLLGKPESYVMVSITDNTTLLFAGTDEPCAHLKLKSLGLDESKTKSYSEQLCHFMTEQTHIPAARIYIEFYNPERHMWGWDSKTF